MIPYSTSSLTPSVLLCSDAFNKQDFPLIFDSGDTPALRTVKNKEMEENKNKGVKKEEKEKKKGLKRKRGKEKKG